MKIVHAWLRELVDVPTDVETVASQIALRGFEVAEVTSGVIDFEITANRPDCMSHLGIAREASAIWGLPLQMPALSQAEGNHERQTPCTCYTSLATHECLPRCRPLRSSVRGRFH